VNKQDRKHLEILVIKYEGKKKPLITKPWFNLFLWLFVTYSIFSLLQFQLSKVLLIIFSAFIGAAVTVSFMIQSENNRWRIIKPYFDIKAVKRRLKIIKFLCSCKPL
jgi:hypothetical protein